MIMAGNNITSPSDMLSKVQEDYLYYSLRNPKPSVEARIRQLRIVYLLDPKKYAVQKRALPYFVCGIFNPPYRKNDNFAYTESFIVDIDKLTEKGLTVKGVREVVQADQRVMICFSSPSEDGLKIMFRLKERCYDSGIYSVFYKAFVRQFSMQYHLEQVVDSRTSDVSRACFVSMDPNVYFNPDCEPVDINLFIDTSNPFDLFAMKHQQDKDTKEADKQAKKENIANGLTEPEKDIMNKIKQCLHPNGKSLVEKPPVFVPSQLEEIMDDLKKYIEETGLLVTDIISIQYGKKVRIKMGLKEAEINLFFGKRGFTVVKSPRCGTNDSLNDVTANLIQSFLNIQ